MAKIFGIFHGKLLRVNLQHRHVSFFSKKKPKDQPYLILRASQEDMCPIIDLMWKAYHREEPTTASVGLGKEHNPVFDEQAIKALSEGVSLVAKCKYDGCIVGASINESSSPWDPDFKDHLACSVCCSRTRQLYHFWAYLQRAPELWDKYCAQKVFELSNVFVKKSDRGKGIALMLMTASRNLGADCGYRVIRVDATSYYTAKICEKMKMKMVHEIPFCSYVGENHQPIFRPPPPHHSVKIYVDTPHVYKKK